MTNTPPITAKAPPLMKLPLGISDFEKIVSLGYHWVDKTLMIAEVVDDPSEIILITRPRRFGKTLSLSMLRHFFDLENKEANLALFQHFQIAENQALCDTHQGKYPVISISLKSVKELNMPDAMSGVAQVMFSAYDKFRYLLTSDVLTDEDKIVFQSILSRKPDPSDLKSSLRNLTAHLQKHHQIKPILLIDEYDEPMHASYHHGYYEEMKTFMRVFLGEALKDNNHLHKAVITGILRIAQASIFSGLNNITVYTVLNNRYSDYFGLLSQEVKTLHEKMQCPQPLSEIQRWYNGYQFGESKLYNPWSIINALTAPKVLKPYWINSAENVFIKELISNASIVVRQDLEILLQGKSITCAIDDSIVFSEIGQNPSALWTLLVSSGYLNITDWTINEEGLYLGSVRIPNYEVTTLYVRMVREWFKKTELSDPGYQTFLKSLVDGDAKKFQQLLQVYITESGSYFDFNQHTPESVYHALVLGMVVGLSDRYLIKSNRESGDGRYDVILMPKDVTQTGILLEFKTAQGAESLTETAQQALTQIIQTDYAAELRQANIQNIIAMGLAFNAKAVEVAIKRW